MPVDDEIAVGPEISQDYVIFEEFCSENVGQELTYFEVVKGNPLDMDAVTLAFSIRRLIRMSRPLMNYMLETMQNDIAPDLSEVLALKGIDLDKSRAADLRNIIFAFRDSTDEEKTSTFIKSLQLLTISRERKRVTLNLGESYTPPEEGWMEEDFGGDDGLLDTVRSIEDPHWKNTEEM
jgi:hypothetical protein